MREADTGGRLHRGVVTGAEELLAGLDGVADPSGQQQAACAFDPQPVTVDSCAIEQGQRTVEQRHCYRRRASRGRPCRARDPIDRGGVARRSRATELLCHLEHRSTSVGQPLSRFVVQPAADAEGEILVDRVANEVVAESDAVFLGLDDLRTERVGQRE